MHGNITPQPADMAPAAHPPARLISIPFLMLRVTTAGGAFAMGLVQTLVFARVLSPDRFSLFILVGAIGYSLWLCDLGLAKILFVQLRRAHIAGKTDARAAAQATAVIVFYVLLAACGALVCFGVMCIRPAVTILEAADFGLFFLYITLNLTWICLRSISIAVDEYVFYEKLELVRRVGNMATILAMLIGLPSIMRSGTFVAAAACWLFPRNFPHWRHCCRGDDCGNGNLGRGQIRCCRISRCLCPRLHSWRTLSGNRRLSRSDSCSVAARVAEMETRRCISRGALTAGRAKVLSGPDLHAAVVERPAVVGWRRLLCGIALRLRGGNLRGVRLIDQAAIVCSPAGLRRGRCLRRCRIVQRLRVRLRLWLGDLSSVIGTSAVLLRKRRRRGDGRAESQCGNPNGDAVFHYSSSNRGLCSGRIHGGCGMLPARRRNLVRAR